MSFTPYERETRILLTEAQRKERGERLRKTVPTV
jgi:hypothetical protein